MKTSLCQLLDDYLDHDLGPAENTNFVAHISECPSCQQAVSDHERLKNLLTEAVGVEPIPEDLVAKIEGGLQLRRRQRWVAASAALAATAAAIWLVSRHFP